MSGWDCGWDWDHNKNNPFDLKPEGLENVFCLLVHVSEKFQSYFSLFTGRTAGITQLAAVCSDGSTFGRYEMPSRPISMEATRATGISLQSGQLLYNGHPVESVSTKDCLVDFIAFLQSKKQPLCIGHNIRCFDCPILIYHLIAHSLMGMFENAVHAFLDTLVMYKQIYPERRSYKQEALVNDVLGQGYNAHNAEADVAALQQLVQASEIACAVLEGFTFSVNSAKKMLMYNEQKSRNCERLQQLVISRAITKCMCDKIGGSGLRLAHLKMAYERNGRQGIEALFGEKVGNSSKIRVTKQRE